MKIPSYLGGMSRGLLGAGDNGLTCQLIHNRKIALKDADLIILAGTTPFSSFLFLFLQYRLHFADFSRHVTHCYNPSTF